MGCPKNLVDSEVMMGLLAVKEVMATAEPAVTVVLAVTKSPAALVTVKV